MAAPDAAPPRGGGLGGALTKRVGGLPAWQWAAIAGVGIAAVLFLRRRSSSSSTTAPGIDPTTGAPYASEIGNPSLMAPVVDQATGDNTAEIAALRSSLARLQREDTSQGAKIRRLEAAQAAEQKKKPKPKPTAKAGAK